MDGRPKSACPYYKEVPQTAWLCGWEGTNRQVSPRGYVLWKRPDRLFLRLSAEGTIILTDSREEATRFDNKASAEEARQGLAGRAAVDVLPCW